VAVFAAALTLRLLARRVLSLTEEIDELNIGITAAIQSHTRSCWAVVAWTQHPADMR